MTFPSVKIALVALFLATDADRLTADGCNPGGSWKLTGEKPMSLLTLVTDGLALARVDPVNPEYAALITKLSNKELRSRMESDPEIAASLLESVAP